MTSPSTRDVEERQDATRLLLSHPLVTANGPHADGYRLVRRHRAALTEELRRIFGYRLVVESGFARLFKAGPGPRGRPRPLRRANGAPFAPRGYSYLALACAVLLTSRSQILLSALIEDIRGAAAEAEIDLGADSLTDRRALVGALRQLVTWGVLEEDDGTIEGYAGDPSAEALLFVHRDIVRHLLAVPLRDVASPTELVVAAAEPGAVGGARHAVRRLIVEEPSVLSGDIDDEKWAWLRQYQRREAQILHAAVGVNVEIRAEGVTAIDPQGTLTDVAFPGDGSLAQAALLTVAVLVDRLRPADIPHARDALIPAVPVPAGLIDEVVVGLVAANAKRWKKDYVERPQLAVAEVTDLLVSMGLLDRDETTIHLRAVAARYAPTVVTAPPPSGPDQTPLEWETPST